MASKLSYFQQLETVARLFNVQGEDVCLRPEFSSTLAKLDECLDYVQNNVRTQTNIATLSLATLKAKICIVMWISFVP